MSMFRAVSETTHFTCNRINFRWFTDTFSISVRHRVADIWRERYLVSVMILHNQVLLQVLHGFQGLFGIPEPFNLVWQVTCLGV